MKKKNLLLTAALSLCAVCATAGIAGANPAKAENVTVFEMAGASVRYQKNDDGQEGIRFRVKLDSATYQSYLTNENVKIETGVLAIPAHELLAGEELNLSTATAKKAVTYSSEKPEENLWTAFDNGDGTTDEGYMQSLVYCYGIPGAYYNAPFAARGYVKITGAEEGAAPEVHYTDVLRQSYLETAYRANLADGNVALETILNANTYEIKGDGQTLQSGKYGDKLNLAEAAANDGWQFTGWSLDGKNKFTADYIKGNATLVSLWDKVNGQSNEAKVIAGITGEKAEAKATYATSYSITMDEVTANEIAQKPLKSLTVAGEEVDLANAEYANGVLTVSRAFSENDLKLYGKKAYAAAFGEGENVLNVVGDLLFVTYEIKSQAELDAMVYVTDGAADGTATYGGYITLGADIAYSGTYSSSIYDSDKQWTFNGAFDGKGHNIDGIIMNYGGLIGGLTSGAAIRNVSFTNAENVSSNIAGFLAQGVAWENDYTVENIYVHFKTFYHCGSKPFDSGCGGYTGIIFTGERWNISAKTNFGKVDKVFVCADNYVTSVGEGTILGNAASGYKGFTNIYGYGIGGKISRWDSENVNACGGVYGNKAAIKAANNDYSAFENDDFWQIDFDGLPYPASLEMKLQSETVSENKVITAITGEGAAAKVSALAQSYTIDLGDVKTSVGGALTSLTVGANTYTDGISYADGKITVNHPLTLADYGYRNYTAVFAENGKELKVAGKTLFITFEITSKGELDSMVYVTGGTNGVFGEENRYGGYIVLANDIAYNGSYAPGDKMEKKILSGTFDGKGHNIDDISVSWASIFGIIGQKATIKNLSITNAVNSAGNCAGFLVKEIEKDSNGNWNNKFSIENIYIHFKQFNECNTAVDVKTGRGGCNGVILTAESWSAAAVIDGAIRNAIVCADTYVAGAGNAAIAGNFVTYGEPAINNVYAFGFGADARMITRRTDKTLKGRWGVYDNKADLKAAVSDYSAFTANSFWQLDPDGVPVSKSAAALSAQA